MRHIKPPELLVETVFDACVDIRRNKDLRSRLNSIRQKIVDSEASYRDYMATRSFASVPKSGDIDDVTRDELIGLYDDVLSRNDSDAYFYYTGLRTRGGDLCPACNQRRATTIDHFLPKGKYAALVVTPFNLVPMCPECNTQKGEAEPTSKGFFLHPYVDGVETPCELIATVLPTEPPTVTYCLEPREDCPPDTARDAIFQFHALRLDELYAVHGATYLSGMAHKLRGEGERGGWKAVRKSLKEDMDSWAKVERPSWQFSLFKGLLRSRWFCREGYLSIVSQKATPADDPKRENWIHPKKRMKGAEPA